MIFMIVFMCIAGIVLELRFVYLSYAVYSSYEKIDMSFNQYLKLIHLLKNAKTKAEWDAIAEKIVKKIGDN